MQIQSRESISGIDLSGIYNLIGERGEHMAQEYQSAEQSMEGFNSFLLECLPMASRKKLLEHVVFRTVPANKYIFEEGQPADYICILLSGRVKLSRIDPGGRENIVMILSEKDTIWESLFLYGGVFPYSAITMTDTRIGKIYRDQFIHILDNQEASLQIITLLSRKLHDANQRNIILATQDPLSRLAGFLLYTAERTEQKELYLRLEEIAATIGLRMETVSRKLKILQEKGLVRRTGNGRLELLEEAALREIFQQGNDET